MKRSTKQMIFAAAVACATVGTTVASCTSTGTATVAYAYDDPYLYSAYYPADVAYASYYYAYPWNYTTFYYYLGAYGPSGNAGTAGTSGTTSGAAGTSGTAGASGTGGTSGTAVATHSGVAAAIEALARGQQVCPGQVTVSEKTAPSICVSNAGGMRAGATITFNNCAAPGGTINGMIVVQGTATASDQTCSATTMITVMHTSTFTNLSIKVADGRTLAIPNQTNTGMTTFTFGQSPTTTNITSNGELQIMDSAGAMQSDLTFMGESMFTFSGSQSYKVDGTTTVQDKNGGASATITRQGLVRSGGCCRPTGGTLTVDRTGGSSPGQASWSFGPSCNQIMRNGTSATMPTCM